MQHDISMPTAYFCLSTDKQKLLLPISKIEETVSASDIIENIKKSAYKNFKIYPKAINESIQKLKQLNNDESVDPAIDSIIIGERLNAQLFISLDPLKLTAKAEIISAFGGAPITLKQLISAMQKHNINTGIQTSAIKLLLDKSAHAPAGSSYKITIAKGKNPINGHDAYFSALIEPSKELLILSIAEQYGSVDMNAVENMIAVQPGTKLIRKYPHIAGEAGLTVTGERLKHSVGKDIPFHLGENTEICKSDPNLLVSSVHGTPVMLNIGMKVEAALILDNLTKGAEPICHNGTLVIKGDVPAGTSITAMGDITVIGFIESSDVKCSGDLFVSKGILGEKTSSNSSNSDSHIQCAGSIYANFIQYSTIKVGHDLNLQYQLIHSHVFCDGYIYVHNKEQQRGAIFGGYLSSKKGIRTVTLGARSGVKTNLDLSGYYLQLENEHNQLHKTFKGTNKKLHDAVSALQKVIHLPSPEKKLQLNKRLVLTIKELKHQLSGLENKIKDNQTLVQDYLNSTKVIALKTIFSDVSVSLGKDKFRTTQTYGATTIHVKNHKLTAESYFQ